MLLLVLSENLIYPNFSVNWEIKSITLEDSICKVFTWQEKLNSLDISLFLFTWRFEKEIQIHQEFWKALIVIHRNMQTHTNTYCIHTYTLSQSHTLPPRLWDGLFSHRHTDYSGMLIYSAVIVVFGHFLFSSSTLIYSIHLYLPVNAGSIQTSCSHPLQSKQRRTSHYEGWPTTNTKINMWLIHFDRTYGKYMWIIVYMQTVILTSIICVHSLNGLFHYIFTPLAHISSHLYHGLKQFF